MSATMPMPTPVPTPAPRPSSVHPLPQPHPSPPIDIVTESTLAALRLTDFSTPASPAQTSSDLPPPDYSAVVNRPAPTAANGFGARPGLSAQEISNREKQAIRDARRREDEARERGQVVVLGEPLSPPPDSVEPSLWDKSHSDSTTVSSPRPAGASPSASTFDQPNGIGHGHGNVNSTDTGVGERGGRRSRGNSVATVHTVHTRKILPEGLQVKEALARCEDPTLGWSLQFWITIADPVTQHVFFACPATGQTSWNPPEGVFIVPRQAAGEWWELADTSRGNRSYFYNTLTKKTQWTRPGGDAFVIPLGLIQRNSLPERTRRHRSQRPQPGPRQSSLPPGDFPNGSASASASTTATPSERERRASTSVSIAQDGTPTSSPRKVSGSSPGLSRDHPFMSSIASPLASSSGPLNGTNGTTAEHYNGHAPLASPSDTTRHLRWSEGGLLRTNGIPLGVSAASDLLENGGISGAAVMDNASKSKEKRISKGVFGGRFARKGKGKASDMSSLDEGGVQGPALMSPVQRSAHTEPGESNGVAETSPVRDVTAPTELPKTLSSDPIPVDQSVRVKRLSTGLHPLLPFDISTQIQDFRTGDFAEKYFATKRTGMLRQRVPLERLMEWQRAPITSPLLVHSKSLAKEASTTFKVIQHVMGERVRPVEGTAVLRSSASYRNLAGLNHGRKEDVINGRGGGGKNGMSAKTVVLEEVRWMVHLGVSVPEMRDEIYCQAIKQLTKNPDHDAAVLGFQLFCVLVNAFGPSKEVEPFVRTFLLKHTSDKADGVGVMSKYCLNKLQLMAAKGGRGRSLTLGEIEHASDAAFYPSVYGESLEQIMDLQKRSHPTDKVPVILPFLADAILALGGTESEGIFRIPGDGDSVSELKSRIDRGNYELNGIDDPHVASSLFKLFLRELSDPLVPSSLYNDALSSSKSPEEALAFVQRLPICHRRVLVFVISFLQLFMEEQVVEQTKMTPSNLALVLAPNILRTTSNSLATVFTNSSFESKFVLQLLENLDPKTVDPDYVPKHGPTSTTATATTAARKAD